MHPIGFHCSQVTYFSSFRDQANAVMVYNTLICDVDEHFLIAQLPHKALDDNII